MPWVAFGKWKQGQLDGSMPGGQVDFDAASALEIMLLTSAVNPASHVDTWEDVAEMLSTASVAEVSGSGYARRVLAGNDVSAPASGVVTVDATDPTTYSEDASGFTNARYAILTGAGADASTPVVAYYDLGANKGNTTGTLSLTFAAAGIFTLT